MGRTVAAARATDGPARRRHPPSPPERCRAVHSCKALCGAGDEYSKTHPDGATDPHIDGIVRQLFESDRPGGLAAASSVAVLGERVLGLVDRVLDLVLGVLD
jgi:hypothetical protein